MKSILKISFAIVSVAALTSCYNRVSVEAKEVPAVTPQSLSPVKSDKKMISIGGGTYMGFLGKDSGRIVQVKSFQIDESPVTNSEFLEFLRKNPQWTRSQVTRLYADDAYLHNWQGDYEIPRDAKPESPVTNISWFAAEAYAKSVGKRLPTIDEWEFAALADENSKDASGKPEFTEYILNSYQKKGMYREAIKQQKPNYYGLYDLYGMVWEWTEDFNSVMISGESRNDSSKNESLFCSGAAVTTSDLTNYAAFMRYAMRGSLKADYSVNNLGFRCAKDL